MPYFKNSEIVKKSISSVLNQDYINFELIIIDDGSNDNIEYIINEFHDSRIRLIKQSNRGVSSARNRGIVNSKYKFLCFLDSDDTWTYNHLSVLKETISRYPSEMFFVTGHKRLGNKTYISNETLNLKKSDNLLVSDFFKFAINKSETIHTNSVCIKKKALSKVGLFEEGVNRGEDVDLWLRLACYYNVIFINKTTTLYNREFSTLTSNKFTSKSGIFIDRRIELLSDESIDIKKKKSIEIYLDRISISSIRKLLITKNKKKAIKKFKEIKWNYRIILPLIITKVFLVLPVEVSSEIVSKIYLRNSENY